MANFRESFRENTIFNEHPVQKCCVFKAGTMLLVWRDHDGTDIESRYAGGLRRLKRCYRILPFYVIAMYLQFFYQLYNLVNNCDIIYVNWKFYFICDRGFGFAYIYVCIMLTFFMISDLGHVTSTTCLFHSVFIHNFDERRWYYVLTLLFTSSFTSSSEKFND